MGEKRPNTKKPTIIPGEWRAELLGAGSVHLGGTVNLTPTPHAIEFSWVSLPASAHGPNNIVLPAVVVLMAPAEVVVQEHPGSIMQNGLMTMIDLSVTRLLFSDLLPKIENGLVRTIRFTVKDRSDQNWPISTWSVMLKLADR